MKISSGRQFDIHLQGLHELCSWGHREGMQKLRHLYQVRIHVLAGTHEAMDMSVCKMIVFGV